jgi:hypothetical protein
LRWPAFSVLAALPRVVRSCNLRIDRPDFDEQAIVQTGIAFGDLHCFLEIVSKDGPVTADRFFGFTERAVGYRTLSPDCFAFVGEPLPGFHFALVNQFINPGIESVEHVLFFLPREGAIPLSAANYQELGGRVLLAHDGLSLRLVQNPLLFSRFVVLRIRMISSLFCESKGVSQQILTADEVRL